MVVDTGSPWVLFSFGRYPSCESLCGYCFCVSFFFFQAEDGIRYLIVTGVQTCALPIYHLQARVDEMTVELRSAEERLDVMQSRPATGPPGDAQNVDESVLTREQELAVDRKSVV